MTTRRFTHPNSEHEATTAVRRLNRARNAAIGFSDSDDDSPRSQGVATSDSDSDVEYSHSARVVPVSSAAVSVTEAVKADHEPISIVKTIIAEKTQPSKPSPSWICAIQ